MTFPPSSSVPHVFLGNQTVFLTGPFSFKEIQTSFVHLDALDMFDHCSVSLLYRRSGEGRQGREFQDGGHAGSGFDF